MEKWKQVKIKHHYVWEYYLKNWTIENKVFWLTTKGKIAFDSPKGLCREDGFYKISTFNSADLEYIKMWSQKSPEFIQKQHAKSIAPFIEITNKINLARSLSPKNEELIRLEEVLLNNSLEDLYCAIESGAKRAIDGLKVGNISILDDKNISIGLYSYLGHQITRTKAMKELSIKNIPPSGITNQAMKLTAKNWWFLSYMLGENIGFSLYASRHEENLFIVKNISNVPFITCDSPVINVHPNNDILKVGEAPEYLDLMFPISPTYVLMITSSSKWNYLSSGADEESVTELNSRIASRARYSIYGNCKSVIQMNKNMVGKF